MDTVAEKKELGKAKIKINDQHEVEVREWVLAPIWPNGFGRGTCFPKASLVTRVLRVVM